MRLAAEVGWARAVDTDIDAAESDDSGGEADTLDSKGATGSGAVIVMVESICLISANTTVRIC
jgi:hypothetical protein